jgi:hypothetical protein
MNIIIVEKKVKMLKGEDGKPVESIEKIEHEFEAHPQELVGSVATRFAKKVKMPQPVPGVRPTLSAGVPKSTINPDITIGSIVGRDGAPKSYTVTGW